MRCWGLRLIMKLESHLGNRSGMLHIAPMLDTMMLLVLFFLLGGSFVLHSGIEVDVPISSSTVQVSPGAPIITVAGGTAEGGGQLVAFNGEVVPFANLHKLLLRERTANSIVVGTVFWEAESLVRKSSRSSGTVTTPWLGSMVQNG